MNKLEKKRHWKMTLVGKGEKMRHVNAEEEEHREDIKRNSGKLGGELVLTENMKRKRIIKMTGK